MQKLQLKRVALAGSFLVLRDTNEKLPQINSSPMAANCADILTSGSRYMVIVPVSGNNNSAVQKCTWLRGSIANTSDDDKQYFSIPHLSRICYPFT